MSRRHRDTVSPALRPLDQRRAAALTPPATTTDAFVGPGGTLPIAAFIPQSFVGRRFRVGGASLAVPGRFRVSPVPATTAASGAVDDADTVSLAGGSLVDS